MLTKQAYTLIARVIRELPVSGDDRAMIAREFASVLKADNPAFRNDKFSAACEERQPWHAMHDAASKRQK